MLIKTTDDRTTEVQAIGHIRPKQAGDGWTLRLFAVRDVLEPLGHQPHAIV